MIIEIPMNDRRRSEERYDRSALKTFSNDTFIQKNFHPKQVHYLSRTKTEIMNKWFSQDEPWLVGGPALSLGIQAIHTAFALELPLSLSPDLLWYFIVHEMAITVHQNPERYRDLFANAPGKTTIEVRDDSLIYGALDNNWGASIHLFREPLQYYVGPVAKEVFLPTFSTTTPESEIALLVTFMDVVSDYYDYSICTRCGIPKIRLEGTPEDWELLLARAKALADIFTELKLYFENLMPVLEEICATASGQYPDERFWRSIYKMDAHSGGQYINGWITAFLTYARTDKGFKLRESLNWRKAFKDGWGGLNADTLPGHASKVPFLWKYFEQQIPMLFGAGVFGIEQDGEFLTPKLGFGVFE